jgi:ATP-dependent Clp protease protease subunit
VSKKLKEDLERFHDYGIYIPSRTIFIGSEENHIEHGESGTDGAMAERTIKNLHLLDSVSSDQINIYMNNLGGDEYACFAIIDAIRRCQSHVVITAMGHAMSAGSLILQAGDERVMTPLAVQMLHYGSWSCNDHSKTFKKWSQENDRINNWMEQYYLEKIREKHETYSLGKLKTMLDHDTFLTAEESVELGLCDRIELPARAKK